jgi:hypothetical protein
MVAENDGKILTMAEGQMKIGEDGWNKKAYIIGISDEGSIGDQEGNGRPIYHTMAHSTE